jgi:hypothetical protein
VQADQLQGDGGARQILHHRVRARLALLPARPGRTVIDRDLRLQLADAVQDLLPPRVA